MASLPPARESLVARRAQGAIQDPASLSLSLDETLAPCAVVVTGFSSASARL